jgi:hypothetical protein
MEHPYPMHVYAFMGYVVCVIQPSGKTGFFGHEWMNVFTGMELLDICTVRKMVERQFSLLGQHVS